MSLANVDFLNGTAPRHWVAPTVSNVNTVDPGLTNAPAFSALYVGNTGNVQVYTLAGDSVIFTAVPAGAVLQLQFTRVQATTGSNLLAGV
jgi:hypothetical protein